MNTKLVVSLIVVLGVMVFFPRASYAVAQDVIINDNDLTGTNRFEYNGNWLYNFTGAPLAHNADVHVSNTAGSFLTFHFTGTQVKLYGVKANYFGIGAVSLDGGAETMIDFYSPDIAYHALMYTSPVFSNGPHSMRVRVTGNRSTQSGNIYIVIDRAVATVQNACNKSSGDANCDGKTDLVDFEIWRGEFVGEITTKLADFNNDGTVNLIDFESWRNGFNTSQ